MTHAYSGTSAKQRWLALMLIVALHAVGLWCWPARDAGGAGGARIKESALTFVTLPARAPLPAAPARPAAARQARRAPPQALRKIPAPMPLMPAPAPAEQAPAPAPPDKSAADIMLQAKRDVGKIDRELRSASLDLAQRHLALAPTARERSIGAAFVEPGPARVVEEVMSDGRRRSRIGNKCAYMESNGLVGARDVFRDGVKTRWEKC